MRPEKISILDEMRSRVGESGFVLLVNYRGLKVSRTAELRRRLKKVGARFHVVNSSMLSIVVKDRGWKKLPEMIRGQTAIVVGSDEVGAAKVLKEFSAEDGKPEVLAGNLGDVFVGCDEIKQMADLPPLEILRAQVVRTIAAPMSSLVGVLNQKLSSILYVLKAVESKKA